ncbi:MAG: hypothetical protein ACLFUJ_08905 [Phycisphaerae bacterium]
MILTGSDCRRLPEPTDEEILDALEDACTRPGAWLKLDDQDSQYLRLDVTPDLQLDLRWYDGDVRMMLRCVDRDLSLHQASQAMLGFAREDFDWSDVLAWKDAMVASAPGTTSARRDQDCEPAIRSQTLLAVLAIVVAGVSAAAWMFDSDVGVWVGTVASLVGGAAAWINHNRRRCPHCRGRLPDRRVDLCGHCGEELPAETIPADRLQ